VNRSGDKVLTRSGLSVIKTGTSADAASIMLWNTSSIGKLTPSIPSNWFAPLFSGERILVFFEAERLCIGLCGPYKYQQ